MELKKIVLITSGQPSTNPRLVKEADALSDAGYEVTVLYQYWDSWAELADQKLLSQKKWKPICLGGKPLENKLIYFLTRSIHKISRKLYGYLGNHFYLAEFSSYRSFLLLYLKARKLKADLYISHNLGSLAPAVWASKKNHAKCGFDAEDFHRHERTSDSNDPDVILKSYLENKYIPQLNYLTTASPLINEQYHSLFPSLQPQAILNVFPKTNISPSKPYQKENPLKLFWFSQKIGPDRGIEDVFSALKYLDGLNIEFHLLGKPRPGIKNKFDRIIEDLDFVHQPFIFYYPPVDEQSLMAMTATFDIGLALEPGFSPNNHIALSNKIFTYLSVGLCLICSNSKAQKKFMEENQDIGSIYPIGNEKDLAKIIKHLYDYPEILNHKKLVAFDLAQTICNWETESQKFLTLIKETLD